MALRVGGPATAENAWVVDFIAFCTANGLPADFVSTHHYPTDAFGMPGDDTITQLSKSTRSILREQTRAVRKQAGDLPVYYTEWCTSSNPRDALHDDPYAAAFIVKTVLEANGLVQGYSYWTFSDIFEENYFPSLPFHGGFGLLNLHGIAKPAYRAYQLLHGLGTDLMQLEGTHETVDAWLVRGEKSATLMLTNFALPRHPIATQTVSFVLKGAPSVSGATIQRIDLEHANAKRRWEQLGKPEYLSAAMVAELDALSRLQTEVQPVVRDGGTFPRGGDDAASSGRRHSAHLLESRHGRPDRLSDDALVDRLQRGAFSYLTEFTNDKNGLVADTSREGSPCSIAVVGFALSCYPVAVKNGWMSRAAAAAQNAQDTAVLLGQPSKRSARCHRLQGFLLSLPAHGDGAAGLAVRAVARRHHASPRRRADGGPLLRRGRRRAGNPQTG
jgi:hypothetical protein